MTGSLFSDRELSGLARYHWRGFGEGTGRLFRLYLGADPLPVMVTHCGHPTALRPWAGYIRREAVGQAWRHVKDAQAQALALWMEDQDQGS